MSTLTMLDLYKLLKSFDALDTESQSVVPWNTPIIGRDESDEAGDRWFKLVELQSYSDEGLVFTVWDVT